MSTKNTLNFTTKGLVNLVVSFGLALPTHGWARETHGNASTPAVAAKDGVPVIYQEFDTPNGRAFTFMAAVPEEIERETILRVAGHDPKNVTMAFTGPDDPGFRAAVDSGNLDWIRTYKIGKLEDAAVVRDEPDVKVKNAVVAKTKEMWGNVKSARYGVMMGWGYAGTIATGAVYLQTSSVTAAVGTLIPMGLMAAFQASQSRMYLGALNKGGDGAVGLIEKMVGAFGSKLDAASKVAWKKAVMFGLVLAINGAQAKFITSMAGEHVEAAHLMMLAAATTYSVWDLTIDRLVAQHKIDHKWEPRYFAFQIFAGTLAELAMYMKVPNMEAALGVATAAGLGYLIAGEKIEATFSKAKATVTYHVDTAKGRVTAATNNASLKVRTAAAQAMNSVKSGCDGLLGLGRRVTQMVKK